MPVYQSKKKTGNSGNLNGYILSSMWDMELSKKKLMVELKNLRKRLQERIDLEKNGKKEQITFSIEFMTLC
jgi:hypothetical protein